MIQKHSRIGVNNERVATGKLSEKQEKRIRNKRRKQISKSRENFPGKTTNHRPHEGKRKRASQKLKKKLHNF